MKLNFSFYTEIIHSHWNCVSCKEKTLMLQLILIFINCPAVEWLWTFLYAQWSESNLKVGVDAIEKKKNTLFCSAATCVWPNTNYYNLKMISMRSAIELCVSRRSIATLLNQVLTLSSASLTTLNCIRMLTTILKRKSIVVEQATTTTTTANSI